jgi:hypothetical protein
MTGVSNTDKSMNREIDVTVVKTIEARVVKNIKEEPSNEHCDVWNIEATFLDKIPGEANRILADPHELQVDQIEGARTDCSRTSVTIRTRRKSGLEPGDVIHLRLD